MVDEIKGVVGQQSDKVETLSERPNVDPNNYYTREETYNKQEIDNLVAKVVRL